MIHILSRNSFHSNVTTLTLIADSQIIILLLPTCIILDCTLNKRNTLINGTRVAFSMILVPIYMQKRYHFACRKSDRDFREFSGQHLNFSVTSCQGEQSDATYQSTDASLDNNLNIRNPHQVENQDTV